MDATCTTVKEETKDEEDEDKENQVHCSLFYMGISTVPASCRITNQHTDTLHKYLYLITLFI